ncbi:hypothetical protein E1B28_013237 [Marasmius oreades]|uniref:Uncharacterized protein n=1 Tax=Marasmius oreades TaxID=181124 RepID=A0A9P7UNT7_9AGAR|nr:uncharacterized protein E1B28_013237 [Marasmius oreades]KAG7087256.1 hypothetical protein E1B28_013237 [Marasmius oreades]
MGNTNRAEAEEESVDDDSNSETSSPVSSFPSPTSLDTVIATSSASHSRNSSLDTLTEVGGVKGDSDVEMKNRVLKSSCIVLKKLSEVSEIEEVLERVCETNAKNERILACAPEISIKFRLNIQ